MGDEMMYNAVEGEAYDEEQDMNVYEVLNKVADITGIGTTKMAELAGKHRGYVSSSKARGSIPQVDTYARLLHSAGWSLVAVPTDAIPDNALVIDAPPVTDEDKRALNERKKAALLRQLDKLEAEGELLG